ncbi:MAG: hypothetical protein NEHIOOID_00577 [Holosporales bacterium]
MKKYSHMAFAFSLTVLNATEQGQALSPTNVHQTPVVELVPIAIKLTKDDFINQLTQRMHRRDKACVILAVANVDPDRYTDAFINTVNQLSQGMYDNTMIIEAVGNVDPDSYTDAFINMLDQLSLEGHGYHKARVIEAVANVDPDRYTDAFINTVNQLSQERDGCRLVHGYYKTSIIEVVAKVSPDHYERLINTVNQLTQGMDADNKTRVIVTVAKVSPDHYERFIDTINQLSQGMDADNKSSVIVAVGKVHPDHYERFINTVNQLTQGMDADNKTRVIVTVAKVSPDHYERFIDTINQLSQGMDADNKSSVIVAVGKVHPDHYPFLKNFIEQNPAYFRYVLTREFEGSITPNMTQPQLREHLQQLHRQYHHQAPPGTPQALAFEIHAYANQEVADETGQKQPFNEAVLNHIQRSIQGRVLNYGTVLDLLRSELTTLKNDPLTSGAINDAVFNWVIESNQAQQDKNAMTLVATYLEQKDHTHKKLATWLYTFMDESKKAYDGRNTQSCMKGVKERVITSLRSSVLEGDAVLENLFHQAESTLMTATKSKKLTDYAFWAQKLQAEGVTSTTPQDVAKDKFSQSLRDYFEGVTDANVTATIEATLDAFDDSEPGNNSLRLPSTDGLWSKIKAELIRLERGGVQPARLQRS